MRLDDASEHMNLKNWLRMKELLDKYNIKPIYGIIPFNEDPELLKYEAVSSFWEMMAEWKKQGWEPALHGCNHVFETREGGINPINLRSEFAGLPLERQLEKLHKGYEKLKTEGINPSIFFAPAHTFDDNTLKALYEATPIRVISDTIAWDVYFKNSFFFIPQQSGKARNLPFKTVTFCYHPNSMNEAEFDELRLFLKERAALFTSPSDVIMNRRKEGLRDKAIRTCYFIMRKARKHFTVKSN